MADNRDIKTTTEASRLGKMETQENHRAILAMYEEQTNAIVAKHDKEIEVNRIEAKMDLLDELIELSNLKSEKEKLEADLKLAQAKVAEVKVPNIDWFKLGEPKIDY
ncbi:hypothetical protein F2Q68_00019757 [Brassica cretica]|uniref:Uncharacterized protein n=1 Tax=Brassica cretica TaxID=69181 RepID=A0A8S9G3E8_BRACR|nr:hypothetical protein F2Q68_00019757 [Brassica cretica]